MKELHRFRQFLTEGVIKEDNLKDYWSEWAAGEVEVGNDGVIDAGGVDADFKDVPDDTMDTFKRYVKAVKTLNADSKELRDDIAGAVSAILYDGGDFEDYEFDVLTSDQFDKISEGVIKEDYKNDIKEGVDIDQMKIEIEDVASYLEDVNKEEEVMSNVLDRHDSDPFETMGEVYAYLDGLLQKY